MSVQAAMKLLGEVDGVRWFWAEPGLFTVPGVYYWDGNANVHVTATRAATVPPGVFSAEDVAELIEACRGYVGPQDDPDIGWRGASPSHPDIFKCERCDAEHLDCFLIPHTPYCRANRLIAAMSKFTPPAELGKGSVLRFHPVDVSIDSQAEVQATWDAIAGINKTRGADDFRRSSGDPDSLSAEDDPL